MQTIYCIGQVCLIECDILDFKLLDTCDILYIAPILMCFTCLFVVFIISPFSVIFQSVFQEYEEPSQTFYIVANRLKEFS